jgi:hypothetical protein
MTAGMMRKRFEYQDDFNHHNPEEQPGGGGWPHPVQQGDVHPQVPAPVLLLLIVVETLLAGPAVRTCTKLRTPLKSNTLVLLHNPKTEVHLPRS